MGLIGRASRLLKANINHLLDNAEDPEVMIKDLIREMDESVAELRRETVNAVARQKQLAKRVETAGETAGELEEEAALALEHGNEPLARRILGERVDALKARASLRDELKSAASLAQQLKSDLVRMEEQAGLARRKKDELIRRKNAAEAQIRTQESARKSADAVAAATGRIHDAHSGNGGFDGYADAISEMEARAEAARELSGEDDDAHELRKLLEANEVDKELERLKQKHTANQ